MTLSKFSFIAIFAGSFATALGVITPQTTLSHNPATSTCTIGWYGATGHTYFIQHSFDLMTWQTMPVIESGSNAPLSWSMQITANRTFFRLLISDLPTGGNAQTADFDGDGLNNLTEINLGANPINVDSDRDEMPDIWEYQHGFSLIQPGATQNADNDSLTNLGEYLAGTNPNVSDATLPPGSIGLLILSH
jgi:hypothetical protein